MGINKIGDKYRKYNIIRTSMENGEMTYVFSIAGHEFGVTELRANKSIKSGKAIVVDGVLEYIKPGDFVKDRVNIGKLSSPFQPCQSNDTNMIKTEAVPMQKVTYITDIASFAIDVDTVEIEHGHNETTVISREEYSKIESTMLILRYKLAHTINISSITMNEADKIVQIEINHRFTDTISVNHCLTFDDDWADNDLSEYIKEIGEKWTMEVLIDQRIANIISKYNIDYDYMYKNNEHIITLTAKGHDPIKVLLSISNFDKDCDKVLLYLKVLMYPITSCEEIEKIITIFKQHDINTEFCGISGNSTHGIFKCFINNGLFNRVLDTSVPLIRFYDMHTDDEIEILYDYIKNYSNIVLSEALLALGLPNHDKWTITGKISDDNPSELVVKIYDCLSELCTLNIPISNLTVAKSIILDWAKSTIEIQSNVMPSVLSIWERANSGPWLGGEPVEKSALENAFDRIAKFEKANNSMIEINRIEFLNHNKTLIKIYATGLEGEQVFILHENDAYKMMK